LITEAKAENPPISKNSLYRAAEWLGLNDYEDPFTNRKIWELPTLQNGKHEDNGKPF
jgi:hypothetical protein